MKTTSELSRRLEEVRAQLGNSKLIVVTKTKPKELLKELVSLGVTDVGENYIQEMVEKQAYAKEENLPLKFHLIGPLQSNKFKLLKYPVIIHTLEKPQHVEALLKAHVPVEKYFVQVNVSEDPDKHGVSPEGILPFLNLPMRPTGLMTILQQDLERQETLKCYKKLKQILDFHNLSETSMGMSDDFDLAVQAGATYVRVGSKIVGARTDKA